MKSPFSSELAPVSTALTTAPITTGLTVASSESTVREISPVVTAMSGSSSLRQRNDLDALLIVS